MCQRGERRRAECSLVATLDQGEVNRFREFATQARLGFALGVIDDELDDRRDRNGQRDWLRVAQSEPRGPIVRTAADETMTAVTGLFRRHSSTGVIWEWSFGCGRSAP